MMVLFATWMNTPTNLWHIHTWDMNKRPSSVDICYFDMRKGSWVIYVNVYVAWNIFARRLIVWCFLAHIKLNVFIIILTQLTLVLFFFELFIAQNTSSDCISITLCKSSVCQHATNSGERASTVRGEYLYWQEFHWHWNKWCS